MSAAGGLISRLDGGNWHKLRALINRFDRARCTEDHVLTIELAGLALASAGLSPADRLLALRARGRALLEIGKHDQALADLDAVLAIDATDADDWYHRGIVLNKLFWSEQAADSFDRAAVIAPTVATHVWRAACRHVRGDLPRARAAVEDALRVDPYHVGALQWRTQLRWDIGDRDGALEDLALAIDRALDKKPLYLGRALLLVEIDRLEAAIQDYGTCLDLNPDDADVLARRAELRGRVGDTDGALADWERVIRLKPEDFEPRRQLIVLSGAIGRFATAVDAAEAAVSRFPNRADAHGVAAEAYRRAGRLDLARSAAERSMVLAPRELGYARERLRVLIASGDRTAALAELDDLLGRTPRDAELRFLRGELHREAGRWRGAISDLDLALRLAPDRVAAWTARARVHLSLGLPRLALADIGQALKHAPDDPVALVIRGDARICLDPVEPADRGV